MSGPVQSVCKTCGSDNIVFDSYSRWDPEKQELVHSSFHDAVFCEECNEQVDVEEIPYCSPSVLPVIAMLSDREVADELENLLERRIRAGVNPGERAQLVLGEAMARLRKLRTS